MRRSQAGPSELLFKMTKPNLQVRELRRFPSEPGRADHLVLQPGVNVLVGPPNTGKSQWLRTLDLLLGSDKRPEDILAEVVYESYDSAEALVTIGEEELLLARRWKEPGAKTKIFVNEEPWDLTAFSHLLYDRLRIPVVHYPQGNAYGPRTWPELSWRSILRHMYRRQRFWTDIADKQPESEQHACILQFLGLAERLFSSQYGQLVQTEKEIQALRARREDFLRMLEEISRDLVDEADLGVALTEESLDDLVSRLEKRIQDLEKRQDARLRDLTDEASDIAGADRPLVNEMTERLALEESRAKEVTSSLVKLSERLSQIQKYRDLLAEEYQRLGRASEAALTLSAIQISHCPACDRKIESPPDASMDSCILCRRPWAVEAGDTKRAERRVDFERRRLQAEQKEAESLLVSLESERDRVREDAGRIAERISALELRLRPVRSAAAAVLPAEVAINSIEIGSLQQRLLQIRRVRASLAKRKSIGDDIALLTQQLGALEAQVRNQRADVDFTGASEALTEGMNSYLNRIHATRESLWAQKPVALLLDDRGYRFLVGDRSWHAKLGGTATLFFLIAYHYGLMALTGQPGRHYPGFLVLDFPAELDDGTSVGDKENFVLEPFVDLLARGGLTSAQVIAAGSSFENLEGVHRIKLERIWS